MFDAVYLYKKREKNEKDLKKYAVYSFNLIDESLTQFSNEYKNNSHDMGGKKKKNKPNPLQMIRKETLTG